MIDLDNMTTLGVADFKQAIAIIDLAASRGAFKGEELLAVGTSREKLALFVNQQVAGMEAAEKRQAEEKEPEDNK